MTMKRALSITGKIDPARMSAEESRKWNTFCIVLLGIIQSYAPGKLDVTVQTGMNK